MNATHFIIRNRAETVTKEGWIHIVPAGELPNHEAGVVQVLDDQALDAILRNIAADRTRLGDRWPGLYAGREHFIYNDNQDSAALAWFKDFEKRPDGIWAKEDGLTDLGREAIRNGRYKFTSFVADRRDAERLGDNRYRILKLDTVGFTNQANGKELLTPMTNRFPTGAGALADSPKPQNKPPIMKNIAVKLGLSAEASEDAIAAEVGKFLNRADISPAALKQLQDENASLKAENKTLLEGQVEADLAPLKNRVSEEKLTQFRAQLLANRSAVLPFIQTLTEELAEKDTPEAKTRPGGKLLNRGGAGTPKPGTKTATGDDDQAVLVRKQTEAIEDYRLLNRCSNEQARAAVRRKSPELFGLPAVA